MAIPLVSVIIPTYNRKQIVLEAVQSVLVQEPKNFEIVLVDDGSTDGTKDYLHSLHLPIRIIVSVQGGAGHARNIGIKKAKGEFVAFLDSDDLMLPGCLSAQLTYLQAHQDIPLVYTDQYLEFDGKRSKQTRFQAQPVTEEKMSYFRLPCLISDQAPIHTSAIMVRKSVFDEVGFFNEALVVSEDVDMWNRISEKCARLGHIDQPFSVFRWGKDPNHLLQQVSRKQFTDEMERYLKLYELRRRGKLTQEEEAALAESHSRLKQLKTIDELIENGQITKSEYHKRRQAIFGWAEYA